jgi:predicted amidohydrolase
MSDDRKIKTACVQLRCGDDVMQNLRDAAQIIRAAHKDGAQFIATPENTDLRADGSS